jgi:hypothetical protein
LVEARRFRHLAVFAAVVVAAVVVLSLVDQAAIAVVVGLIGIVLIGAAVPLLAIEQDERGP